MKRLAFLVGKEIFRSNPNLRRGFKVFALFLGLAFIGVGLLTAWLGYLAFGQLQTYWNSELGEKIVTTTSQQTETAIETLKTPNCQQAMLRLLDPGIWLIEGIETHWDKARSTCFPGLAQAEKVLERIQDAEG